MRRPLGLALVLLAAPAAAQPVTVTFRFLPDLNAPPIPDVVRAFLPGSFNDWGPNSNGQIAVGAPSQMTFDADLSEWRYTRAFAAGDTAFYKVHYHRNASGTTYEWITDPLASGPCVHGQFGSDCRIEVGDPMLFQLAREEDGAGQVVAVSAGVFGSQPVTALSFTVNGEVRDGLPHFDAGTRIFRFALPAPAASAVFSITATDALNRTVTASVGFPPPVVVDAPVPAGLRDGINVIGADRVTLVLLAPGKEFVHLIGDATGWEISNDFLLKRDQAGPLGTRWWIELTGLSPDETYRFQYLVEGEDRISDPYAELVLDASNDPFITPATYPDLPPYPVGLTTDLVSAFRTAAHEPQTPFSRPAMEDLVVYELLVRDFVAAHDFATVEDTLDYLDELGINAIELMPVSEFDGNINWGYGPNHYFAVDKYYGPANRLRHLIDEAHRRGIAVLLDVVYNHQTGQAPFVRLYNEGSYGPPTPDNPWVNPTARHPFNVFNDNNHESLATQAWLDRANRFWLEQFNVDGFRFDLSKGFVQTCAGGGICTDANFGQYNQGRINLLTRMADALWSVDPNAYIILEHFADWTEERVLANHGRAQGRPGMTLWHNMNRSYSQSAMGYLSDASFSSDLRQSYPPNNTFPLSGQIAYMESHDEQWLMFRNRAYGAQNGTYDIRDLNTALQRQELVAAFFLTVPGPKMIWQFGELGYGWGNAGEQCLREGTSTECPTAAPGRTDPKPIRWDYYAVPERRALYDTYRALLHARFQHPVFRSPDAVTMQVGQGQADRWIRLVHGDMRVVVVGNFGTWARVQTPPLEAGTWHEYFSREVYNSDGSPALEFAPGEYRLYSSEPLGFPYPVASEPPAGGSATMELGAPYPNPAAGAVTVPFTLRDAGAVRLEVFDVLGRSAAVLVDATMAAGSHVVRLDGAVLPSGTYVVRLTVQGFAPVSKVFALGG